MEAPGYAYICALAMRLFGDAPLVCRAVNYVSQFIALASFTESYRESRRAS